MEVFLCVSLKSNFLIELQVCRLHCTSYRVLHFMNLINYSKHLVVAYFEITLIAYKLLRLILLRESPLVLPAPVADCASTPFTVMSSFLHQDTEVLSETLVARIALIKDLLLKVIFKFVGKPLCPFFLFPSLVTLWLLLCY